MSMNNIYLISDYVYDLVFILYRFPKFYYIASVLLMSLVPIEFSHLCK